MKREKSLPTLVRALRSVQTALLTEADFTHADLYKIWDTANLPDDERLAGAGFIRNGKITSYHVSDDPERVLQAIAKRTNFVASYGQKGQHAELGPGLYLSSHPEYWKGRAKKKWDFLRELTPPQLEALVQKLREELPYYKRAVTPSELDAARRTLNGVENGNANPTALLLLANQPYNIDFSESEWLKSIGITQTNVPRVLEVTIEGRFAELTRNRPDKQLLRTLKKLGVDGVFTRPGLSTAPELALWNPRAIVHVKEGSL